MLTLPNRDFKPASEEWIHVSPLGEFPHPSGRLQIIDDTACHEIMRRFREAKAGPNFPGLLVDQDHFSDDETKPTDAAGWIIDMEVRRDGLWALAAFTDLGDGLVNGGRYRFVSPVFRPIEDLGRNRVRPLGLDKVALCNAPNIRGMVPLSNRQRANPVADSIPDFTRHDAVDLFINRVNQAWGTAGLLHAWPQVREEEPCLYGLAFLDPVIETLANRANAPKRHGAYNYLSPEVPALVNRLLKQPGRSFQQLWNELRMVEPEFYGLSNRESAMGTIPLTEALERLARVESAVRDQSRTTFHQQASAMPVYLTPAALHETFWKHLNRIHRANPQFDFEACWEFLKEEHPSLFTSYCLNLAPQ